MLDVADFLFPRNLQVTRIEFRRCLLIGSCMSEAYRDIFNKLFPETEIDYIIYNNVGELGDTPPRPLLDYDFQYIQIPINSLIGSGIQKFVEFSDLSRNQDIFEHSHNMLRLMIDGR